jgi:large subunit ribosomal protein L17
MRHARAGNHLSRTSAHRDAMVRNLASSLIEHERIRTTLPKARNLRPFVEKLVTMAKDGTLHHHRLLVARLHNKAAAKKLIDVLGPRFKARPGGYTRILKIAKRRLGDGGDQAIIEFVERTPKEAPAEPTQGAKAEAGAGKQAAKAGAGA